MSKENKSKKLLKILETGEMSKEDLEPGGEWYEARLEMERLAKEYGFEIKVYPFDAYQGPFGLILSGPHRGKRIWFDEDAESGFIIRPSGHEKRLFVV